MNVRGYNQSAKMNKEINKSFACKNYYAIITFHFTYFIYSQCFKINVINLKLIFLT